MTGQPDIAAALGWSEQVIRDVSYLMAALRGEPTPALAITSTPVPLASLRGRVRYGDAASPAGDLPWPCTHIRTDGHEVYHCTLPGGHEGPHRPADPGAPGWVFADSPLPPAASPAGVAEGVPGWNDPLPGKVAEGAEPGAETACSFRCGYTGHGADLADHELNEHGDSRKLCVTTWGDPANPNRCALTSGHDEAHRTAEGVAWLPDPLSAPADFWHDPFWDGPEAARCGAYHPGNAAVCTLDAGHKGQHAGPPGSAAEVAEGVEPGHLVHFEADAGTVHCGARAEAADMTVDPRRVSCPECKPGAYFERVTYEPAPGLCPAQWGEGEYLSRCSLPSGHEGNHADHGIEYAGHWETAEPQDPAAGMWTGNTEAIDDARNGGRARYADHLAPPAGYSLPSIERPDGCICLHSSDPGGFHIADQACPVHGLGSELDAKDAGGAERPCLAVKWRDGRAFKCCLRGDHQGPHRAPQLAWGPSASIAPDGA